MVCIYCSNQTSVANSRHQKRSNTVWRRRSCDNCQQIFTTIEKPDLAGAVMVEKPGGLEGFSQEKLLISIYEACKHRPEALEDALGLAQTITGNIMQSLDATGTISRAKIIASASTVLTRFDAVAATVYAAFHK